MIRYALTIFLGAFLLFQVQPMIGKFILPWFGGGAGVWTACLLFFQVALLVGYAYAHGLGLLLRGRGQIVVHLMLVAVSLLWLPMGVSRGWIERAQTQDPTLGVMLILAASIGLPYIVLSATSPLMQRWFAADNPGKSPYRLYALSNLGSVLALVSYPFVLEPSFPVGTQSLFWSVLYAVCALGFVWCGLGVWRHADALSTIVIETSDTPGKTDSTEPKPTLATTLYWLVLAATGSLMLMSATNFLTQDIAPLPLLWVLPLALYLISFIVCFEYEKLYNRWVFVPLLVAAVFLNNYMFHAEVRLSLLTSAAICLLALFAICMVCHGELARAKPAPRRLTFYYLMIALGGALGGLTVALIAPLIFQDFWEYHAGLLLAWLLVLIALVRTKPREGSMIGRGGVAFLGALPLAALAASFVIAVWADRTSAILIERNFYGSFRIEEVSVAGAGIRRMRHGTTLHGSQFMLREQQWRPAGYYGQFSGMGVAIRHHPIRKTDEQMRLGVVGLGAGTTATYVRKGDYLRFYEINPAIVDLAQDYFTYLEDARARGTVDIALGDARIVLERELVRDGSHHFDVLAIDAFSSDAIPVHLLTREASDAYWGHLKPDGILAIHISNRHLDLLPVVFALAEHAGKKVIVIGDPGREVIHATNRTSWVLLTNNEAFLNTPEVRYAVSQVSEDTGPPLLWTDDYASIWSVLGQYRVADVWTQAPMSGYFVLDQAPVLTPEIDMELGDRTRTTYRRTGGGAMVVVVLIESLESAMINAPPGMTLPDVAAALRTAMLKDSVPTGGYMLLMERTRKRILIQPMSQSRYLPRLSEDGLIAAAQPILDRANAQANANVPLPTIIRDATLALCDAVEELAVQAAAPPE